MEDKKKILEEQEAPLKNTDDAFVQVGHDGEPVIPEAEEKKDERPDLSKHTTNKQP